MPKFDRKSFNPQAFGKYMETVPKERLNALIKANIFRADENIRNSFSSQTGTAYAIIPMTGRLKGKPVNYDGETKYDKAKSLNTFERGVVVFGRKDKFTEQDFSYDITAGKDFMSQVGDQLSDYWDDANEDTLIAIIKGIFASKSTGGKEFAEKHTFEIEEDGLTTVTLNSAIQKACGDKKRKFSLVIMNSLQATELENQKQLTFLTQTDANGVERELNLAQWNGKLVLVDDSTTEEAEEYVMYILGAGMIDREDIGAKVPYEMVRDADNDRDLLYSRERLCYAPHGFSYLKKNQAKLSPTDEELSDGTNWDLATDGDNEYYPHKEIAIARVVVKKKSSLTEIKVSVPSAETSLNLGEKTVQDLCENLSIDDTGKVTGTLKHVENWTEFSKTDNTGNFIPLYFEEAKGQAKGTIKCELKGTGAKLKKPVAVDPADGLIVFQVHDKDNTIEITSEGKETKTLTLNEVELQTE